jgi:two-component system nitrogen regulation response regulator GlnG
MVAEGTFRGDLFYRLNVFTIFLPPLRDRGEDIPLLARHFVHRFGQELKKDVRTIPDETLAILQQYNWPGNVREFQSVIKQALLQTTGPVLLPEFLPPIVRSRKEAARSAPETPHPENLSSFIRQQISSGATNLYADCQAIMERQLFQEVLQHTGGNLTQAARILGITRATLRTRLAALNMAADKSDDPPSNVD